MKKKNISGKKDNGKSIALAKKMLVLSMAFVLSFSMVGCNNSSSDKKETTTANEKETSGENEVKDENYKYKEYAGMTAEEIVSNLTLEQKACQMMQPACYNTSENEMKENCYGSILSIGELYDYEGWADFIDGFQQAALESDAGIPYFYGQDQVHGVYGCLGAVIFPHNIGLGAANDEDLMYDIGLATADESKLNHMLLSFSPCVAQSVDPRWGRTYESYGSDLEDIKKLSVSFTKGLQDGGIAACVKHYFGDGNVLYGTGENSDVERLIDRGDATLTDDEIDALLDVYQAQIDAGCKVIMISHSSVNGVKMHENDKYIKMLKEDMGFEGFILSDWDSIKNTSLETYYDQVVTAVNSGIDMLMEVATYNEAVDIIVEAVGNGDISEERIDDAVKRIIQVKLDLGMFEDPLLENVETVQSETGSQEYRDLAEKAVEESLVLLKDDDDLLPLKEGSSVYIMGPAADDKVAQCGGWTLQWQGSPMDDVPGVTSIKEGFEQVADDYGITVYTDEADAEKADVVVLAVGEKSYAEWYGDAENMDLCGDLAMDDNADAIEKAKELGKPVITLIVAGRHVFIDKYIDDWGAVVMCYLPGSEGQGVAKMLCGDKDFTGALPSPWYASTDEIGTDKPWKDKGFGNSDYIIVD